jgi:hypothetical protein
LGTEAAADTLGVPASSISSTVKLLPPPLPAPPPSPSPSKEAPTVFSDTLGLTAGSDSLNAVTIVILAIAGIAAVLVAGTCLVTTRNRYQQKINAVLVGKPVSKTSGKEAVAAKEYKPAAKLSPNVSERKDSKESQSVFQAASKSPRNSKEFQSVFQAASKSPRNSKEGTQIATPVV